ncbi:MAG TPA: hypothetical protein DIS73_01825, partial [Planctomycetia bacterium]|nr:hypothetical protein [Planctomycetia bacterium]
PKERALKRVLDMRRLVRDVLMSSEVQEYIVNIVMATQPENSRDTGNLSSELREYANRYISYGTSPRGGQAIVLAAKATALLDDRINVSFEDVDRVVVAALNHRILINFEAEADKVTTNDILKKAMNALGPKE